MYSDFPWVFGVINAHSCWKMILNLTKVSGNQIIQEKKSVLKEIGLIINRN
jgi:hypothetical protein